MQCKPLPVPVPNVSYCVSCYPFSSTPLYKAAHNGCVRWGVCCFSFLFIYCMRCTLYLKIFVYLHLLTFSLNLYCFHSSMRSAWQIDSSSFFFLILLLYLLLLLVIITGSTSLKAEMLWVSPSSSICMMYILLWQKSDSSFHKESHFSGLIFLTVTVIRRGAHGMAMPFITDVITVKKCSNAIQQLSSEMAGKMWYSIQASHKMHIFGQ